MKFKNVINSFICFCFCWHQKQKNKKLLSLRVFSFAPISHFIIASQPLETIKGLVVNMPKNKENKSSPHFRQVSWLRQRRQTIFLHQIRMLSNNNIFALYYNILVVAEPFQNRFYNENVQSCICSVKLLGNFSI